MFSSVVAIKIIERDKSGSSIEWIELLVSDRLRTIDPVMTHAENGTKWSVGFYGMSKSFDREPERRRAKFLLVTFWPVALHNSTLCKLTGTEWR